MRGVKKLKRVDCDPCTAAWIDQHVGVQTTLFKCKKCGLYYKPSLGHKCESISPDQIKEALGDDVRIPEVESNG